MGSRVTIEAKHHTFNGLNMPFMLLSLFTLPAPNLTSRLSRALLAAWIITGITLLTPAIHAQVKPKVEEEIRVLYLGKWYDAEVIDVKLSLIHI